MRYSFHGKIRASGQQVDGFVEASNATEAIDRLADRGIIGVYSVRPEPKPVKNAVRLSGEAEPAEEQESRQPRRLSGPTVVPRRVATAPQKPASAPDPASAAPVAAAPSAPVSPATEAMLLQVIEKLSTLMGRIEHALSRPMNVMYQAGPVRGGGGMSAIRRSGKIPQEMQSNTLHDIFQNNLDLRKSLDKLASTVGPPQSASSGASPGASPAKTAESAPANVSVAAPSAPREGQVQREALREPARETSKLPREPAANGSKMVVQAQPA